MQQVQSQQLPKGWALQGSQPGNYDVHLVGPNLTLSSKQPTTGFGTLMQKVAADDFRGKRIRLSAILSVKDVPNWSWAGLWIRIDGVDKTNCGFDNMYDRRLTGSVKEAECSIVLDVPEKAAVIAFGILLDGAGEVTCHFLSFTEAGPNVSITGVPKQVSDFEAILGDYPKYPVNLDFQM